jgi:LemA protein
MNYFSLQNIIIAAIIIIVLWLILTFNGLVRRRYQVKEAWSDIEVQLKRRYDLIPNLIETVKGYLVHERTVFEKVTEARTRAINSQEKSAKAEAENMLSNTLKTLFAVAENYPELKANTNFLDLQRELTDTENKIQAARRFYNSNIMEYNTKIEIFPNNLIAGVFGFKKEEFFDLESETEKEPVKVSF